jgi:hypothetical protein
MGADKNLQIDSTHCRAICDEIGERLRIILDRETTALPPRLQVLMLRFAAQDLAGSPSIVPSIAPVEKSTGSILAAWSSDAITGIGGADSENRRYGRSRPMVHRQGASLHFITAHSAIES